jgi:bacteriochlorophyllide a dehydrogenase
MLNSQSIVTFRDFESDEGTSQRMNASVVLPPLKTMAVVLEKPEHLVVSALELTAPGADDLVVDIEWSGISTGTERLLWSGSMPPFPGLGYPLVPGYESVGRISAVGADCRRTIGERVFVPGARCFGAVRGLFGGAASRLVVPQQRATRIDASLGEEAVLLALAATAQHAIAGARDGRQPDLIVGHGVLGRLLARLAVANGAHPTVWERNAGRRHGAQGYRVIDPAQDKHRDYRAIYDVSGDSEIIDSLVAHLAPGGEIVLAGFYTGRLAFAFPAAFMREAQLRIAAEWRDSDLLAVTQLAQSRRLDLGGLITHREAASDAPGAYRTAFTDPACLKMILDWRAYA